MTLRDDYNRDGYVALNVSKIHYFPSLKKCQFEEQYNNGIEKYISYLQIQSKKIHTQKLLIQSMELGFFRFIDIDPIIVSQPVLHVMSPTLRIPNGYYGTGAHQDWASTQGSLDCVTVWIALTDAGIGNFPLEVVPGSHLGGLRDGKLNGSVLEVEADDKEFVPIECKAGDVIFLSGFTVHRTGKGSGFRVAVSQRFDNASEPTFIERGYPCAQKRVVERDIKWKPSLEQVQQVFK